MTMYGRQSGRRSQAGQALLLAVVVLLVLALLAAAMIAVVSNSIQGSERDEYRVQARSLAWAGIRYADEMLSRSLEGADWRPALPAYLDPRDGTNFDATSFDYYFDRFERLQGWDSRSVSSLYPVSQQPSYFVKYRFRMDPEAISELVESPTDDPGQDFVPGFPEGRPVENVERTAPHDSYLLRVEYAPNPADPLSKYLKITAIGRPGMAPTAFEELVAYKAVGISDYLLFVHDRTRQEAVTVIGQPPVDIDGDGQTLSTNRNSYTVDGDWNTSGPNDFLPLILSGPVRTNLSTELVAPLLLNPIEGGAAGQWQETVEIANTLTATVDQSTLTTGNAEVLVGEPGASHNVFANDTVSGAYAQNQAVGPAGNPWPSQLTVGVPRLEAPTLESYEPMTGVSRWDRLTKYSGAPVTVYEGAASRVFDGGELGYGRGIYIDNVGQRDLFGTARNTWQRPDLWGGRRYVPNGVLIELHPDYPHPTLGTAPAIVITRTDGSTWLDPATGRSSGRRALVFHFPDQDGTWQQVAADGWPMPDRGLIVCEGNVRVRGRLPLGTATANYNLTVVSRGTIYVDGPLLRPSDWTNGVGVRSPENTRIALLARDNVVINPTALAPGRVPGMPEGEWTVPPQAPTDGHWALDASGTQAIGVPVPICRDPVGTGGSYWTTVIQADGNPVDGLEAKAAVVFAKREAGIGVEPAAAPSTLTTPYQVASVVPGRPGLDKTTRALEGSGTAVFFADWANLANAIYASLPVGGEFFPDAWDISDASQNADADAGELGIPGYLYVQADPDLAGAGVAGSRSDLIVKNLKIERLVGDDVLQPRPGLDLVVSALMFAERGTFFVIPGDYFDPRAQELADVVDITARSPEPPPWADEDYARLARLKRYNYRVTVNGAIAVNTMPSLTEVGDWTDKWCHPTAGSGVGLPDSYAGVIYRYDWGLRDAVGGQRLRLRYLPASPGLVHLGEENKR